MAVRHTQVRHWLPIITFCPVNHLPDLIYVEVAFRDDLLDDSAPVHELYGIRKRIRKIAQFKKKFMEDIAADLFREFTTCDYVTVTLAFGRHVVTHSED